MNEKLHTLITLLLAFQSDPDWCPEALFLTLLCLQY